MRLAVASAVLALFGCSPSNPAAERVEVGLLLGVPVDEVGGRWRWDRDLVAARCQELGVGLSIEQSEDDPRTQIDQAHLLLERGIDVLIVVPGRPWLAGPIVSAAKLRGVPVISYDRLIPDADVDLHVSFDARRVGELQAAAVQARRARGGYVLIGGSESDPNAHQIREGQLQALGEALERGDVTIVADDWTRDWHAPTAGTMLRRLYAGGAVVDAILAANDTLAGAAIEVLAERGLAGTVPVAGQDATLAACQRIVAGTQVATVYKPFWLLAKRAVEGAIALARGEPLQQNTRPVANGRTSVPAVLLEPILVDRHNLVETVVKDGYHSLEDVFAGLPREEWPEPP